MERLTEMPARFWEFCIIVGDVCPRIQEVNKGRITFPAKAFAPHSVSARAFDKHRTESAELNDDFAHAFGNTPLPSRGGVAPFAAR